MEFVETLLKCLWPEEVSSALKIDGWFAVASVIEYNASNTVPRDLVADCLLTAAVAHPRGPLLSILFRRLSAPLLCPKVPSLSNDNCIFRAKFEQVSYLSPCFVFER